MDHFCVLACGGLGEHGTWQVDGGRVSLTLAIWGVGTAQTGRAMALEACTRLVQRKATQLALDIPTSSAVSGFVAEGKWVGKGGVARAGV